MVKNTAVGAAFTGLAYRMKDAKTLTQADGHMMLVSSDSPAALFRFLQRAIFFFFAHNPSLFM